MSLSIRRIKTTFCRAMSTHLNFLENTAKERTDVSVWLEGGFSYLSFETKKLIGTLVDQKLGRKKPGVKVGTFGRMLVPCCSQVNCCVL